MPEATFDNYSFSQTILPGDSHLQMFSKKLTFLKPTYQIIPMVRSGWVIENIGRQYALILEEIFAKHSRGQKHWKVPILNKINSMIPIIYDNHFYDYC